jgi:L-lysine 2,3-aminomutase
MCTDLSNIAHIKTIRFHSRVPIILPERVNSYFISGLSELIRQGTKVVMVIHCNHANELSDSVGSALKRLSDVGVVLLNQSVLLKGINDSVQTLVDLSH